MKKLSHGCTLDCFDTCKFNVYVDDNKILKVEGDKNHPFTKGFICVKGRKHLERLTHKDRILTPLKKEKDKWVEISFSEAIGIIKERLLSLREEYGSDSVLHYSESGSGSVLKAIDNVFFNIYGGVTVSRGSTCWGAGMSAQKYDFGEVRGHFLEDMFNSKTVVIWGRNPANTSVHLMNILREVKKKGITIIVIDPLYTETARLADYYIRINPSTDGALAMALTKIVIEDGLLDEDFIKTHVKGFKHYSEYLDTLDINFLAEETGIPLPGIRKLAELYAGQKPSCMYLGYGLQKYQNGGNTIRAIDALAAVTGNIGKEGGGVNYANRIYPGVLDLDPYKSCRYRKNVRFFDVSNFSDFITTENNPPIKAIFISRANPLTQFPDLNKSISAFKQVEFKVCFDLFMTDTARHADLFIPCTNTFESEDLVYTSMCNPYIIYNEKAVEPLNPLMDEYYFFQELASEMKLQGYPFVSKNDYLEKVIEPLKDRGITLEKIKAESITIQSDAVAWRELNFTTPSGKFEIFSEKAAEEGFSPIPVYQQPDSQGIRLITSHPKHSIFSQHYIDTGGISQAYISPCLADKNGIDDGEIVMLTSKQGKIQVQVRLNIDLPEDIIHMYTGWWEKHGNPNFLTANNAGKMGGQIAYYDTFVDILKAAK